MTKKEHVDQAIKNLEEKWAGKTTREKKFTEHHHSTLDEFWTFEQCEQYDLDRKGSEVEKKLYGR